MENMSLQEAYVALQVPRYVRILGKVKSNYVLKRARKTLDSIDLECGYFVRDRNNPQTHAPYENAIRAYITIENHFIGRDFKSIKNYLEEHTPEPITLRSTMMVTSSYTTLGLIGGVLAEKELTGIALGTMLGLTLSVAFSYVDRKKNSVQKPS